MKDACELARALRLSSCCSKSSERDNEAASLHIRRHCARCRVGLTTGTHQPGVLRQRVPVDGEAFRTMSLYLEVTSKAKLASCVSSRELCRSLMTPPERSEVLADGHYAGSRSGCPQSLLHEETEVTEFSNCAGSWLVK